MFQREEKAVDSFSKIFRAKPGDVKRLLKTADVVKSWFTKSEDAENIADRDDFVKSLSK